MAAWLSQNSAAWSLVIALLLVRHASPVWAIPSDAKHEKTQIQKAHESKKNAQCGDWCMTNPGTWLMKCALASGLCVSCPPCIAARPYTTTQEEGTPRSGTCALSPSLKSPVASTLFGVNDVLGSIVNLSYSDLAVKTAVEALKPGVMRYPGGTVANYWSMRNGSYVGPQGEGGARHCKFTGRWNYCAQQRKIQRFPPRSFTPFRFYKGVVQSAAGGMPDGPIFVLNLLTLTLTDIMSEIQSLKESGAPVVRVELGNEYDHAVHYRWRFPNADSYGLFSKPVIRKLRKTFPGVKISFVISTSAGGPRGWNARLSRYQAWVDAVSVHDYSPNHQTVSQYPVGVRSTVVAAWGDSNNRRILQQVRKRFPGKEVWRTEFNFPGWGSGPALPDVLLGGALAGILWASTVLSGVHLHAQSTPIRALLYFDFAHQEGNGWGNDKFSAVSLGTTAEDVAHVRVRGVAQIFSHVARAALVLAGSNMWTVAAPKRQCGGLSFRVANQEAPGCLLASAFSPTWEKAVAGSAASFVVVNYCTSRTAVFQATPLLSRSFRDHRVNVTQYTSGDPGGWAKLPADSARLPWQEGPLEPQFQSFVVPSANLDSFPLDLPAVSLTVATIEPISRPLASPKTSPDVPADIPGLSIRVLEDVEATQGESTTTVAWVDVGAWGRAAAPMAASAVGMVLWAWRWRSGLNGAVPFESLSHSTGF